MFWNLPGFLTKECSETKEGMPLKGNFDRGHTELHKWLQVLPDGRFWGGGNLWTLCTRFTYLRHALLGNIFVKK